MKDKIYMLSIDKNPAIDFGFVRLVHETEQHYIIRRGDKESALHKPDGWKLTLLTTNELNSEKIKIIDLLKNEDLRAWQKERIAILLIRCGWGPNKNPIE